MAEAAPNATGASQGTPAQAERYFFRHRQGTTTFTDSEGSEFANLPEAEHEAISSLREIIASMLLTSDEMAWDGAIEIVNEHGDVLLTVTYLQAAGVPT
jgi:hypothetical protein